MIQSAFGFQGQKCSACSRVLVLEECYDRFLARLSEAVKGITIGNPEDPKNFMGPVVDKTAQKNILEYIEVGKEDGNVLIQVPVPDIGTTSRPRSLPTCLRPLASSGRRFSDLFLRSSR